MPSRLSQEGIFYLQTSMQRSFHLLHYTIITQIPELFGS